MGEKNSAVPNSPIQKESFGRAIFGGLYWGFVYGTISVWVADYFAFSVFSPNGSTGDLEYFLGYTIPLGMLAVMIITWAFIHFIKKRKWVRILVFLVGTGVGFGYTSLMYYPHWGMDFILQLFPRILDNHNYSLLYFIGLITLHVVGLFLFLILRITDDEFFWYR